MAVQARDRDDRRRGERLPINPEFAAQGPGLTFVSNLSEYGVFINTRVRLPVGTAVDLRFTVLLDDPVVIHGAGRVVHHQDEPRGMGVSFSNLAAVMQLRVIDAINWYRARAGAEQAFRTRELTPDELAQIDEEGEEGDESTTSLSSSDMVAESGAGYLNASIEELAPTAIAAANAAATAAAARRNQTSPSASQTQPAARSSPAPIPAPPPAPLKDDEYEDF
ncbi:MAG TPA: PilZ domain-containing protein [Nannocystis sp.]|jgi:hypothetical protein